MRLLILNSLILAFANLSCVSLVKLNHEFETASTVLFEKWSKNEISKDKALLCAETALNSIQKAAENSYSFGAVTVPLTYANRLRRMVKDKCQP